MVNVPVNYGRYFLFTYIHYTQKDYDMKTNSTIDYFNAICAEIFDALSNIKYAIIVLEINESKRFIGFSIDSDYYKAQITILTPNNIGYVLNRACSMQLFSFDDYNLQNVLYETVSRSIEECILILVDSDISSFLIHPKHQLN